jgi:predicted dehydrogenase
MLFASLADAGRHVDADIVVATVRTQAHHAIVAEALERGYHVLVEKPFASTVAEAVDLVGRAAKAGRVLMVSQNYRHHPAPRHVADRVRSGEFGRPTLVAVDFRRQDPGQRHWSRDVPNPLLADMAIHHFDLMRMVLPSSPVRLSCRTRRSGGIPFVDDQLAVVAVEFDDGTLVSYRGSWISGGETTPWAGEWSMDFPDGEIRWTSRDVSVGRSPSPDRVVVRRLGAAPQAPGLTELAQTDRAGALTDMVEAVETGVEPAYFSSGADNLRSLAMVEAAMLSASRDGDWVAIGEILDQAGRPEGAGPVS